MGKIKKDKNTAKTEKSKIVKVANNYVMKPVTPKKTAKSKKLQKKVKSNKQTIKKDVKENKGVTKVTQQQLHKGLEALLQYEESKQTKDLFTREIPLFLQIDAVRIPHCPSRRIRLPLKHTLLTDKQEVCLIVPDLKRGRRIDHEPTVEHYEDLLRSKNVKSIKRIIPIRQLRVEYDQFELKRRLCGYYEHFLVAGEISGHVVHLLGKTFLEKRKAPVPINIHAKDLVQTIEKALKKATIHIHPHGASYIVQFGHSEMNIEQLTENLKSVSDALVVNFPGGWQNIRSLHIKTDKSISIPVYYTLKSANKVNVPVIKPIRPKEFTKITGELTTKLFNNEITVHPGGKVELEKRSKNNGVSKNQLRKIKQGKIQKRNLKLRARKEKVRSKAKIKAEIEKQNVKTKEASEIKVSSPAAKKQKKNKKDSQSPAVKQESQTKQRKSSRVKQKVSIKQENIVVKQEKIVVKPEKIAVKQEKIAVKQEKITPVKQKKTKKEKKAPNLQNATKVKKGKKNKNKSKTVIAGA